MASRRDERAPWGVRRPLAAAAAAAGAPCNVTSLSAAGSAQAAEAWGAHRRCPSGNATQAVVVPPAYAQLVLAQAVARQDPAAAMSMLSQVLGDQDDSGLMPALPYGGLANCSSAYPPTAVWALNATAGGSPRLAAPPLHASATLDVFYRAYAAASQLPDPAASSAAQAGALLWLRSAWDPLFDWHAWLWRNRVLPPPPGGGGGGDGEGLLFSLSPFESSLPWAPALERALANATAAAAAAGGANNSAAAGCAAAAPVLNATVPAPLAQAAGFPSAGAWARAWCQTGCVLACGGDPGCVAGGCALAGFVSAADNALFAAAGDDLGTIGQWLSLPSAPSAMLPVPPAQLAQVAAWRGRTAAAVVDALFAWDAGAGGDAPCAGWVYDAVVAPPAPATASAAGARRGLQLQTDTQQASGAWALGVTLTSEQEPQRPRPSPPRRQAGMPGGGRGDAPPVCPGTSWRDAVVATLLSPGFEGTPMLPTLSRLDGGYRPRRGFAGPVWAGVNARALWGLANRANSAAAVRALVASQTEQAICTATTSAAGGNASAPPAFFSAYDASSPAFAPLPNATAAFAGAEALLAPAWAALLLGPTLTPVPLPSEFVGGGGLLAVMVGELVVVFLAAGLCVALGARQISRLRTQQQAEEAEAGAWGEEGGGRGGAAGPLGAPLLWGGDATAADGAAPKLPPRGRLGSLLLGPSTPGSPATPAGGGGGGGGLRGSVGLAATAAASVASAVAAHVAAASRSRRKRGSVRFADAVDAADGAPLLSADDAEGGEAAGWFRPIAPPGGSRRGSGAAPASAAAASAPAAPTAVAALREPSPLLRPLARAGSATPSPMLGAAPPPAGVLPSPLLRGGGAPGQLDAPTPPPSAPDAGAWTLLGMAASAAALPLSLVRMVAGGVGGGGGPHPDPAAAAPSSSSGFRTVVGRDASGGGGAGAGGAHTQQQEQRTALLATVDIDEE